MSGISAQYVDGLELRIKELESDVDEEAYIRDRMAKLLAETAVALKGPEKALHRHGWQDLPDVAAKQSAALKLAPRRLVSIQVQAIDSMRFADQVLHFTKRHSRQLEQGGRFERLSTLNEALAAINEVLKGE